MSVRAPDVAAPPPAGERRFIRRVNAATREKASAQAAAGAAIRKRTLTLDNPATPRDEAAIAGLADLAGIRPAVRPVIDRPKPITSFAPESRGPESGQPLSQEALDLLTKVSEGGVPGYITQNLGKIAREHGIDVTSSTTPNDVIAALESKRPTPERPADDSVVTAPAEAGGRTLQDVIEPAAPTVETTRTSTPDFLRAQLDTDRARATERTRTAEAAETTPEPAAPVVPPFVVDRANVKPVIGLTNEERATARAHAIGGAEADTNTRVGRRVEELSKTISPGNAEVSATAYLKRPDTDLTDDDLQIIEGKIGVDANNRTEQETARLDKATVVVEKVRKFLKEGPKSLSDDDIDDLAEMYRQVPGVNAVWQNKTPDEVRAIVRGKMEDPRFKAYLKKARAEALAVDVSASAAIGEAARNRSIIETKQRANGRAIRGNNAELAHVKRQLEQFQKIRGVKQPKLETLEKLTREFDETIDQKTLKEAELVRAEGRVAKLQNQLDAANVSSFGNQNAARLEEQLNQATESVNAVIIAIEGINRKIKLKSDLEIEWAELSQEKTRLESEGEDLEDQETRLAKDHSDASTAETIATNRRTLSENIFVKGLDNVFAEATYQHLYQQIETVEAKDREIQDKEIAEAKTRAEQAVLVGIKSLFGRGKPELRKGRFGRKDKLVLGRFNERAISEGFDLLLQQSRPDLLLRMVAESAIDPENGKLMLSNEELEAKLQDKEYVAKMTPKVIEGLMKAKYKSAGGVSESEAAAIASTEWGANLILEKMGNDPEVRAKLNEAKKALELTTDKEALATLGGKNILLMLMQILGVTALALATPIVSAATGARE